MSVRCPWGANRGTLLPALVLLVAGTTLSQDVRSRGIVPKPRESRSSPESSIAVVVGIDAYEDPEVEALRMAASDATSVGDRLETSGYRVFRAVASGIARIGKADILRCLDEAAAATTAGGRLVFFFSGHGFSDAEGNSYLCASDTRVSDLAATALPLAELDRRIVALGVSRRVALVDACRSTNRDSGSPAESRPRRAFNTAGVGRSCAWLFATADGEFSYEPNGELKDESGAPIRHGFFTHALLRGLDGAADADRDLRVTFDELKSWARDSVETMTGRLCPKPQIPHVRFEGDARPIVLLESQRDLSSLEWARDVPMDRDLGIPVRVRHVPTGIPLVLVREGSFVQGENDSDLHPNENPEHEVRISRPFYMGICEVTESEYARGAPGGGAAPPGPGGLPVRGVSWTEAAAFCDRHGLRLPTESEWEYACRAGGDGQLYGSPVEIAVFDQDGPRAVGGKRQNAFGLHDMLGNVAELCSDVYAKNCYRTRRDFVDPRGPDEGTARVVRGASFADDGTDLRASFRTSRKPDERDPRVGFRVVRDI